MIRFHAEKIVCDVGTTSVTAPPVFATVPSTSRAVIPSGIDPEIPECQITNPE